MVISINKRQYNFLISNYTIIFCSNINHIGSVFVLFVSMFSYGKTHEDLWLRVVLRQHLIILLAKNTKRVEIISFLILIYHNGLKY